MYGEKAWKKKAGLGDEQAKYAVAGTTTGMNLAAKHQMQQLRAQAAGLKVKPSIWRTARTVIPTTGGQQLAYLTTIKEANGCFADTDGKLSPIGFAKANAAVSTVGAGTSAVSHFINNASAYPKQVKEQMKRTYIKSGAGGIVRRAIPRSSLIAGGIGTSVSHAFTSVARDEVANPISPEMQRSISQKVGKAQEQARSWANTARNRYNQMRTSTKQPQDDSKKTHAAKHRSRNSKDDSRNSPQRGR